MNNTPTPETDALAYGSEIRKLQCVHANVSRRLERERDEWKAKYIQQNKDLGCEMMDPNGTIWDHAKKLQDEIRAMKKMLLRIGYPARGSADESADVFAFASEIAETWSLEDLTSRNDQ
jgi:argininosuccinate lyase